MLVKVAEITVIYPSESAYCWSAFPRENKEPAIVPFANSSGFAVPLRPPEIGALAYNVRVCV